MRPMFFPEGWGSGGSRYGWRDRCFFALDRAIRDFLQGKATHLQVMAEIADTLEASTPFRRLTP